MYAIRPQIVFGFIASATAAAVVWSWPRVGLAVGVAFTGLALLNLYALLRLWNLERELTGGAGLSLQPRKAPSRGDSGRSSPERKGGGPGRAAREAAIPPRRSEASPEDDVEALLRERLGAGGGAVSGDISFLPAYGDEEPRPSGKARAPHPREETDGPGGSEPEEPSPEEETGPPTGSASRNVPIPRHFALGTVAIIRKALTPDEVARVLTEQRKRPRQRFGQIAVALGYLTDAQLQELLVAQRKGLFTDDEIREARRRLRAYREMEADSEPAEERDAGGGAADEGEIPAEGAGDPSPGSGKRLRPA